MKKILLFSAFLFFCFPFSQGEAATLYDFVKKPVVEKVEEKEEVHAAAPQKLWEEKIIALAEDWKLSRDTCSDVNGGKKEFCRDQFVEQQKDMAERKNIFDRQKKFLLSEEYCMNRTTYENHVLCSQLLSGQDAACEAQLTKGNRIIIDLENQLLYAMKNCKLVGYSRVTTGKDETPTPTGSWRIYEERGPHYMQNEWFVEKAFYYNGNYAVHDAGWRVASAWNLSRRALNGSHGCTNTPHKIMKNIWEEFSVGDAVQVYSTLPKQVSWELKNKTAGLAPYVPVTN